ncbi:MAG TPA: primosomal protein N' [Bryobacteraceae bacterium]|nr:primosomal protein N' [Bryobacteraceae bacterium]
MYCDVSVPGPVEDLFTYRLPETMRHRVAPGCRILAPFGSRTVAGVVLRVHAEAPRGRVRDALRLLDEQPALEEDLLNLGRWISEYYCCPLGETLRAMTPLASDIRRGKVYSLTSAGHDAARQLHLSDASGDAASQILRLLDSRPLSASYLTKKLSNARSVLRSLEKKGMVAVEERAEPRDPLRASATRLRVEFCARSSERAAPKLSKAERELLSFLELHPGSHNLASLESSVPKASLAARSLARRELVALALEPLAVSFGIPRAPHPLNSHQQAAFSAISGALQTGGFHPFLLEGVTGSGKTEVYLNAIDAALALGRSALMLVPEIGLTPAVAGQFHHRFGERVAILHSAFLDSERAQQWRRIRSGEARVVVATRSGVFAPMQNLGLIVVDEEHDQSYKQQETPRYHGRDVAVVRARDSGATLVLGSATPSLESRYNAERGKYRRLELPERIENRPLPRVELIDMRQEFLETRKQHTFSRALVAAVEERLANGEQAMLLLNRRGFSSFVLCRACGERVDCLHCSVALTYHRRDRRMLCHYCNYSARVPGRCPKCDSEYVQFLGTGSERVEQELHSAFPRARIARLDRDTVRAKRDYEAILAAFREGSYDLLVGTQMIAKGHDIPNVTLVGIVNADVGLGLPDFRAAERNFQLLTQAAGRAGRGAIPGIVLIQTLNPDHYAIRCAAAQNYDMFYSKEIEFRRLMWYPPFGALANIVVRASKEEEALVRSGQLGRILNPPPEGIRVLGPAPAAVLRIKTEYRYQMLIKASSRKRLGEILKELRRFALTQRWNSSSLLIDVDPMTLL